MEYDKELDMFGPSKFIGYKDMSPPKYKSKKDKGADGRISEELLKKWSKNIDNRNKREYIL